MSIRVVHPGLLTTLQDLGRYGYQRYGVIVSGAMDTESLRLANLLVGNEQGEAALEMTLLGPVLEFEQEVLLAITGAEVAPTIAGVPVPLQRPVLVKKGCQLEVGMAKKGCRAYLAVAGGFAVPKVMGSKSTYLRAGLGGYQGRPLQIGDVLAVGTVSGLELRATVQQAAFSTVSWYVQGTDIGEDEETMAIRLVKGGQYAAFTPDSVHCLAREVFQVTPQSDRMGYRLEGPVLSLKKPLEMVSEAVVLGTVQVPPDGKPIILLADRQTAGGYPKIAQVVAADIGKLSQIKPGGRLRFQWISLEEAETLYLERESYLAQVQAALADKAYLQKKMDGR